MKEGHTPDEVASMLGYTVRWIRTLVQRWNTVGEPGIRDRRLTLPGPYLALDVRYYNTLYFL